MSTTAEKLTYLNTTKTLIKDNLNLGGANISNEPFRVYSSKLIDIYKDFLANGTDTLWNNWNKLNGTGESLTLNNTIKGKMKIDLKGNTSQEGTPTPDSPQDIHTVSGDNEINICGKNLFDIGTLETVTNNGVTFTPVYENGLLQYINVNGTASANTFYQLKKVTLSSGTYIINGCTAGSSNTYYLAINMGAGRIIQSTTEQSFTLTEEVTATESFIRVANGTQVTNVKIYPMIRLSSVSDDTYEPYQSTTYPINLGPIELCKIGDYQDVIKRSSGKNLNDGINDNFYITRNNFRYSGSDTGICIEVEEGNYTISTIKSQTRYRVACSNSLPSNTNQDCYNGVVKDGTSDNITINTTGYKYLLINCTDISSIMINEGSTALPYEPYGTGWYLNKQIGKVVLDGSESYNSNQSTETDIRFTQTALTNKRPSINNTGYSNYFLVRAESYKNGISLYAGDNNLYIWISKSIANDISSFKTWLSTHNATLYYVLATPTYTEITDTTLISQLEAIKYSYNNQTNITQTNIDKPFILDVTALGELEI
jgi:hypothetical protein